MSKLPELHESWLPKEHSLYRPRHGGKQRLALICAVVFLLLPAGAFLVGVRPSAFENRKLTAFPSADQGWSWFTQLSPWATDHLPLREQAIHAADGVSQGVFGEPAPFGDSNQNNSNNTPLPIGSAPVPAPNEFPNVLEGKNNWLYLGAELSSPCEQSQPIDKTVAELNQLRNNIVASGRKFVLAIAPDKATMVPQYLPDNYVGKACHDAATKAFWQAMAKVPYVLDLRGDLNAWSKRLGAPIYGPQDAHWSDEGGVTMTRRVAEAIQPGITRTWKIDPASSWQMPADLPPLMGRGGGDTNGRYYSILPDGVHNETHNVDSDYSTQPVHLQGATGTGTYDQSVGMLADSFTIRSTRYLASVFGNITINESSAVDPDQGASIAQQLIGDKVVVVEVAQRTLVSGNFSLVNPYVEKTLSTTLLSHPVG